MPFTRLIIIFKKEITLGNQCFTGFIFKLPNSLAHIIPLSHLTHIFIVLPQSHYNKTDELAVGRDVRNSRKELFFFSFFTDYQSKNLPEYEGYTFGFYSKV